MNALVVSTIVFLTVALCLAFGVGCGYVAVTGILRAFGHKSLRPETAALTTVHASGD